VCLTTVRINLRVRFYCSRLTVSAKNWKNSHTPKNCRILSTRFIQPSWHHQDDEQTKTVSPKIYLNVYFLLKQYFLVFLTSARVLGSTSNPLVSSITVTIKIVRFNLRIKFYFSAPTGALRAVGLVQIQKYMGGPMIRLTTNSLDTTWCALLSLNVLYNSI
jgi:hypothetical protein